MFGARLDRVFRDRVKADRDRLDGLSRLHESLGYDATLERGFAIVREGDEVITTKARAAEAATVELQFKDGKITLGASPSRKPKSKPTPPEQGSLL